MRLMRSCLFSLQLLSIREFDDHVTNANAVWPEARFLAGWLCGEQPDGTTDAGRLRRLLIDRPNANAAAAGGDAASTAGAASSVAPTAGAPAAAAAAPTSTPDNRLRVLELGAACGALSIFLARSGVRITASDIDDDVVMSNIRANAQQNGLDDDAALPLLPHTWGQQMPRLQTYLADHGAFDVIVASDILNYEKTFPDLVATLCELMPRPAAAVADSTDAGAASSSGASSEPPAAAAVPHPSTVFYMVWKRRSKGREQQADFFSLLREAHFDVKTEGQKVFEIRRV